MWGHLEALLSAQLLPRPVVIRSQTMEKHCALASSVTVIAVGWDSVQRGFCHLAQWLQNHFAAPSPLVLHSSSGNSALSLQVVPRCLHQSTVCAYVCLQAGSPPCKINFLFRSKPFFLSVIYGDLWLFAAPGSAKAYACLDSCPPQILFLSTSYFIKR